MNKLPVKITLYFLVGFMQLVGSDSAQAQSLSQRRSSPDKILEQRAASLVKLGRTEEAVDLYLELLYLICR